MSWVRVSDDFYDHPKFATLSPAAVGLWVATLAYANRNLTDGVLPARAPFAVLGFADATTASAVVEELLAAGLWHEPDHNCDACAEPGVRSFVIHDYMDFQPSRAKIENERVDARERMRKARAAKGSPSVRTNLDQSSHNPNPNPNPNPSTYVSESSHVSNARASAEDDERSASTGRERVLAGIRVREFARHHAELVARTGRDITEAEALRLVLGIIDSASAPLRNPDQYIRATIVNSWAELQQRIDTELLAA